MQKTFRNEIVQRLLILIHGPEPQRDLVLRNEYDITIDPILVNTNDPAEHFVNHLWYTIIDQRRDVKDNVIPMMASLMTSGFNPNFVINNKEESIEILLAILTSYGHELKFPKSDVERLFEDGYYSQKVGSRSDAILKTLESIHSTYPSSNPWKSFKTDILKRRAEIIKNDRLAKTIVKEWPYIQSKSFKFFLRDIEPILDDSDMIPVPVDTNVAQGIQKTGLFFEEWLPKTNNIIPINRRTQKESEERIIRTIKKLAKYNEDTCILCDQCDKQNCHSRRIVYLAQALFLMGAEYCQKCFTRPTRRMIACPLQDLCMLSINRNNTGTLDFLETLEEKQ